MEKKTYMGKCECCGDEDSYIVGTINDKPACFGCMFRQDDGKGFGD